MQRMRGNCNQRLFQDDSEIRQLQNEVQKWQLEVKSRTRSRENQVNQKQKEVSCLRDCRQNLEREIVCLTEENSVLVQKEIKIKEETKVIKCVSNRLRENNNYLKEIIKSEQNINQQEIEKVHELDDQVNQACRPLEKLATETFRAVKLVSSKIEQLKKQKDERAFMQHLKLDEIKSAIEKNRHLREKYLAKCSDVQNKITLAKSEVSKSESEKNNFQSELQKEKTRSSNLGRKLETLREELKNSLDSETRQTLLLTTFEKRKSEVEINQRKSKNDFISDSKKRTQDHRNKIKELELSSKTQTEELKTSESETHNFQKYKTKFQFQLDLLHKDVESVSSTFDGKREILDEIKSKIKILDKHIRSRNERFKNQTNLFSNDLTVLSASKEDVKSTNEKIEILNQKVSEKSRQVQTAENEVKLVRVDVEGSEADFAELASEILHLQKSLKSSEIRRVKLSGSKSARSDHSNYLESQIKSTSGQITSVSEKLANSENPEIEKSEIEIQDSIKSVLEKIENLKKSVSEVKSKKVKIEKEFTSGSAAHLSDDRKCAELTDKIEELENRKYFLDKNTSEISTGNEKLEISLNREKLRLKNMKEMVEGTGEKLRNIHTGSDGEDIETVTGSETEVKLKIQETEKEIEILKNEIQQEKLNGEDLINKSKICMEKILETARTSISEKSSLLSELSNLISEKDSVESSLFSLRSAHAQLSSAHAKIHQIRHVKKKIRLLRQNFQKPENKHFEKVKKAKIFVDDKMSIPSLTPNLAPCQNSTPKDKKRGLSQANHQSKKRRQVY